LIHRTAYVNGYRLHHLKDLRARSLHTMDFPKEEERILEFWRKIDAFQTSLKLSEGKEPFIFYDGPPFCTG